MHPSLHRAAAKEASFLLRQWRRSARTRDELQQYVAQRVEAAADADQLDAAIRRERIIDLAAEPYGLCNPTEVCLREAMRWKEKAVTAEQERDELTQRIHELEGAAGMSPISPQSQRLGRPSLTAILKRRAAAADLSPPLPPFVKRRKHQNAESQTTLPRLEDKEMQTVEEERPPPTLQIPPPQCPRCPDLEQQLAQAQKKALVWESKVKRMEARELRSPCFYEVFNGHEWVATQQPDQVMPAEVAAQLSPEESKEMVDTSQHDMSELPSGAVGIIEEVQQETDAEHMQTLAGGQYKQPEPSAIGEVSPDAELASSVVPSRDPSATDAHATHSDPSPSAVEVATIIGAAVRIRIEERQMQTGASAFHASPMQLSPDEAAASHAPPQPAAFGQDPSVDESKEEMASGDADAAAAAALSPSSVAAVALAASAPSSPPTYLGEPLQSYMGARGIDLEAADSRLAQQLARYQQKQQRLQQERKEEDEEEKHNKDNQ